ncbi:MAG: type II toxin-antitoxin system RelE/ParE family toxin [Roseovarius sp.]|uniref:type II toxin-antitoxin system RelE/ParE family toxin n=1 Tax=Roseovarius sp. TaxID=1486281 RepID=UPI0032EDE0C4
MGRYRLLRHPQVATDLDDILTLIAEYSVKDTALRILGEIETAVRGLADLPHVGTVRDDIHPGLRAIPVARKGVICFAVDDERQEVRIVAIGYAGREWARMVRGRGR